MSFDGNTATIILDRDRAIIVNGDGNLRGETGHRLVDRIVNHFVNQVVQATSRRITDVHTGAFTNMFQIRQMLQIGRPILRVGCLFRILSLDIAVHDRFRSLRNGFRCSAGGRVIFLWAVLTRCFQPLGLAGTPGRYSIAPSLKRRLRISCSKSRLSEARICGWRNVSSCMTVELATVTSRTPRISLPGRETRLSPGSTAACQASVNSDAASCLA